MKKTVNPRSLQNLRPFRRGQSGNPGGRPKKLISTVYADLAEAKVPGDKKGRTYAQVLAEAQFRAAIKGKTEAAREIANRIEGKVERAQRVEIVSNDPFEVRVETQDLITAFRRVYALEET